MKSLIFLFTLCSPLVGRAQAEAAPAHLLEQPDSLLTASPPDALRYAENVLKAKSTQQDCRTKGLALNLKARALRQMRRLDDALLTLSQATKVNRSCSQSEQPLAVSLTYTALCLMDSIGSDTSEEVLGPLHEALPLALKAKDTLLAGRIYIYTAKNWGDNESPTKALGYNLRCDTLLRNSPQKLHRYMLGMNRVGMGNHLLALYYDKDDTSSLRQATTAFAQAIPNLQTFTHREALSAVGDAKNGLGGALFYADDLDAAEQNYLESLQIFTQIGDTVGASNALYNLALLAECRNDFVAAIDTLEAAHRLAQHYTGGKTSFMEEHLVGPLYEERKALLKSQHKARRLEQTQYATVAGLVVSLLGIIGIVLFNRLKKRSRQLEQEQQKSKLKDLENALQQREIAFVREKIETAAAERVRIARKLHDDVGGKLISTKWGLETILKDLPADSDLAQKLTENLRQQEESYQAARTVSHQLKQSIGRWWEYLEQLCLRLGNGHTKIIFSTHNLDDSIPADIGEEARMTTQELVINALKSAQATEIHVQIDRVDHLLSIMVSDNGTGFDTSATTTGIGLSNIRERIEQNLGGSVSIDSTLGKGTSIFVDIPLGNLDALDKNILKFDNKDE